MSDIPHGRWPPTSRLPSLNYAALAPMLILFGAACVGVLVEAFVSRRTRHLTQVVLSLLALIAALVAVVRFANSDQRVITADVAVAVDGPALFLQGTLAVLGIVAVLLMAERAVEPGGPFVAQAAITVGSEADRRQARQSGATEVFPLTLFALAGMMLFVSANDLLTMFVALEVFSLPLYLLCALARRRRLVSQEAALKYFLLGAFASAFFLFGMALLYGFAGSVDVRGPSTRPRSGRTTSDLLLYAGLALVVGRPAVQDCRGAVPCLDARRLPGRADLGHRVHGGLHQGGRVRRAAAGALRGLRPGPAGTSSRSSAPSPS